MVTKEQAVAAKHRDEFTHTSTNGKKTTVRVNGACKTWKTRPNEFRLPVKVGFNGYAYIDQDNAVEFE